MGPPLFNIYLCDLFMFTDDIDTASYADDTSPYVSGLTLDSTVKSLQKSAYSHGLVITKWKETKINVI